MICKKCGREFKARGRQCVCTACKPQKPPPSERSCKHCGKGYVPKVDNQTFCSKGCQQAHRKKASRRTYIKTCPICQRTFESEYTSSKYCSTQCRSEWKKASRPHKAGPDRELTSLSIYLIHKDRAAGMKLQNIAELYNRSLESVKKALIVEQDEAICSIPHKGRD